MTQNVTGDKELISLLGHLGANTAKRMQRAVYAAADAVRVEARLSITTGSVSGIGHIASQPGEPPKRDTGHLDTNIITEMTGPLSAETRSTALYAAALEFGTVDIFERPYMRPAMKKVMPTFTHLVIAETVLAVKDSKR